FDRSRAELFHSRARAEAGHRLVESDMAVAADSEKLQVDTAGLANGLLVFFTGRIGVASQRGLLHVNAGSRNIHVSEEMVLHEGVEALGVRRSDAEVFVEIEGDDPREIEMLFAIEAH